MKGLDIESLVQIADDYRKERAATGEGAGGVVVIYDQEPAGWMDTIRSPDHWMPGAIAIDAAHQVWVARGGNDYDGAAWWQPLTGQSGTQ